MRCRCGPRRQVAIIRSPSLLYIICLLHDHYPKRIIITQGVFYMVTIFVIFYMLHGHYPKRIIICFLLVPKSHFCILRLKPNWLPPIVDINRTREPV